MQWPWRQLAFCFKWERLFILCNQTRANESNSRNISYDIHGEGLKTIVERIAAFLGRRAFIWKLMGIHNENMNWFTAISKLKRKIVTHILPTKLLCKDSDPSFRIWKNNLVTILASFSTCTGNIWNILDINNAILMNIIA